MKVSDQAMLDMLGMTSQKPYFYVLLNKCNTIHFQTQSRHSGHLQSFVLFPPTLDAQPDCIFPTWNKQGNSSLSCYISLCIESLGNAVCIQVEGAVEP